MKILIVDDNSDVRAVLRQIIEHYGHDVLEAGDGIEGLELAARHKPDAIISDGLMPRMDGYQFLKALKQDETLKLIPFVFYTAIYIGDKEYELAMTLGADALIVKPKAPDDFWKEFTSALEAHASKKKPAAQTRLPEKPEKEEELFRDYCRIVAARLEEKVGELETVIADHERTKAILQESEGALKAAVVRAEDEKARCESIIAAIGDGISIQDRDFRILYQNQMQKNLVGDHIGEFCYMEYEKREQRCEGCPVAQVFEDGRVHTSERVAPSDKGILHAEITASPLRDSTGRIIAGIEVVRDITERKKAEEVLREQKTFTENLIQNSAVATFVLSAQHTVLIWNRACEELTGYLASELLGTTSQWKPFYDRERPVLADVVMGDDPEKLSSLYLTHTKSLLLPHGLHAERWFRDMNGRERYIVFDAAPIYNAAGEVIAAIQTLQDITERKRAEDMIKESEERYSNLFDNANDMIQSIAPDGHFIYVNPSWLKVLGYSREDLQSLTIFDIIHSSFKAHCKELIGKVMAGEPAEYFDARYIAKDGSFIDVEGSMSVHMVDGKVISIQGILKDVTDSKRLQGQLFQISREWEETFNTITDMVTVHDKDFNIIRANKAAEKILGLPFLEVKKIKCFEYYHGTDFAPEGCPSCQSLLTGKPSTSEIYEPHLKMFLEIRAIPRFDINGNLEGLIHVVRDITERKKNEEDLTTYSRELTALTTASNTLMLITNLDNIYKEICDIIYSVFDIKMVWLGVVREDRFEVKPVAHCGSEDDYLSSIKVTWDDSTTGMGPIGMSIKTKKPVATNINEPAFAIWKAEAQKRGYEIILAVPILHASDKCLGAITFYSSDPDYFTPDRVKLCQIFANQSAIAIENARLVSGLEVEIAKRTHALSDTNIELQHLNRELLLRREEAEAASKSKTDFLANMSHELRTPLNAIIGFSDILADGIAGPIADNQKDLVNDISTSGHHLLSLINDILDLSKVEAGKMELEPEEFNLKGLIEGSLVMFKEKAMKHGIKLTSEVEEGIGNIEADERKIKQVLFNLLSNAIKFTPDGGNVRVSARKVSGSGFWVPSEDEKTVSGLNSKLATLNSKLDGDFIEISVADTGIGISAEDQQRLFQPFQQIETSFTKKYAGTGLGLSLCRRFVELHGGRIWVESEVGKGSRFAFTIPMTQ